MSYTYLYIDILAVIFCLLFSFHKRIRFHRYLWTAIISILLVAIPFIAWDVWFTDKGVWWFRAQYTLGRTMLGLPVEEWLFFFCIPYACIFTFYCLEMFFNMEWVTKYQSAIVWSLMGICIGTILMSYDKLYTLVTATTVVATILLLHFIFKVSWLAKATLIYIFLMPGFFLVNGVLTGTGLSHPIVNYNPDEILNIRILTIPIEDFVYGYALILLNIYCFMWLSKKHTPLPVAGK